MCVSKQEAQLLLWSSLLHIVFLHILNVFVCVCVCVRVSLITKSIAIAVKSLRFTLYLLTYALSLYGERWEKVWSDSEMWKVPTDAMISTDAIDYNLWICMLSVYLYYGQNPPMR